MHIRYTLALGALLGAPAFAAHFDIGVEIPRLKATEYHRPYVAVWIERADQSVAANLAVWYDLKLRDNEGVKWLKDMRQWWRRTGRELQMPVDGLSSATRPPGRHQLAVTEGSPRLPQLAPGAYKLVVEAAREVGGREVVSIPFDWPLRQPTQLQATGSTELGAVTLGIRP